MAMAPRPNTNFQNIVVALVSIIGPLAAFFLVLQFGYSWPLVLSAAFIALVSLYGCYQTWRAPFTYRIALRFIANLSLFTVLFSALWVARS
ncbi:hypothetical protein HFP05_10665 [Rhodanobacter denitrificans]|nr:hypothetical protein [Rhodanobacter denitrificans]